MVPCLDQQFCQAFSFAQHNDMLVTLNHQGSHNSLQEPDVAGLSAAARCIERCRGLLGDKGMHQGVVMSRDCSQHSSEGIGQRWKSVAGCGLSSLAPHDLQAESAVTRIMPRWVHVILQISSNTGPKVLALRLEDNLAFA